MRCYGSKVEHGTLCHCGKVAKWHVMYGSGCGHVCTAHKNSITKKIPSTEAVRITKGGAA